MKKTLLTLAWIGFAFCAFGQSPFGPKQSISTNTGSFPRVIDSGHLNSDAYADIVIGTDLGGTIEWYKNNGNGTFTLQTLVTSTLPRVNGIVIADLDKDSKNDIVATSYSLGKVVWFKNNGNGTFGSEQVIATGLTSASTVKAGDIDNNNTIDVVVSTYSTDKVVWFSNNGSGSFGSAQTISGLANSGPLVFDLADHDLDNDLDVVVAYGKIDAILLFNNNLTQTGSPTFTMDSNIVASANYGLMDVKFGDIDNNGDLEIIKVDQYAKTAWYNKTNGGSFIETVFSTSNSTPSAVGVADIDGDNRNGVIIGYSSTASTDKMTWFRNASTSGEITIDNSQNDIYGITLNDFDNDGDIDMASVSSSQNHLNWFKNLSTGGGGSCPDSDGDGVCDSVDLCPGTPANAIVDATGCVITTCSQNTANFAKNPLTHSGTSPSSTTLTLPSNSKDISFTISNIDEYTKGKESGKYIERVKVTYKNGSGATITKGTYSGDQISSATISIPGNVQSVTISLDDSYDGNASSMMSVNLSTVTYCGSAIPAPSTCTSNTDNFSKNPLTHTGSGSNSTTLSLPVNSKDASFTISNIDSKTKGKQGSYYTERVIVSYYIEGSSTPITYGTYSGANVSSATININGTVKSITVNLSDGLSGNTSSNMSISLSTVNYCINSTSSQASPYSSKETSSLQEIESLSKVDEPIEESFKIFPNPATHKLFVKSSQINDSQANLALYNLNGLQVRSYNLDTSYNQTHELNINGLPTGIYILRIISKNGGLLKTERIIIK